MDKKLIIIIAVFTAVVIDICVGFIRNDKMVEKQNTNENLANINIVKPNMNENNNVDELNNNVIENESNTIIAEKFKQETNDNSSQEKNESNHNKVTPNNTNQDKPKEETSSKPKEKTTDVSGQVSVVPYAMTEDEIKEVNNGNSHTFKGTVITINDRAVFVKPDDSYIQEYGSKVSIDKADFGNGLELNDRVEITFIGEITKTYPGSIHVVSIKKF